MSAFFFWMSALLKPPSTTAYARFVILRTIAIGAKSVGSRIRAITIDTTNDISCIETRSANFHDMLDIVL